MPGSYLESVLTTACPPFGEEWATLARTWGPGAEPSASDLLAALRAHVEERLAEGRVADVVRLFFAVERLLEEADPILQELIEGELLAPLAAACRAIGIDQRLVLPHLGRRSRVAWERGWG